MATTDPVQIVIEIVDQFSDDLAELRAQLEAIDAMDIDVDFDINDVAREVADVHAQIGSIPNSETVWFHARMRGLQRVRAQIASAQAQAASISLGRGLPSPGGGLFGQPMALPGAGGGGTPDVIPDSISSGEFARNLRNLRRQFGGSLSIISRFTPNIMMVWNALAAMIPVIVSLAAAAIGLAGAFGALATAGAAVVGAGLLGWGDTFGENMDNLTEQLEQLGSRLFDVMQPAATTFQPILQDWLEGAPRQLERLVGPMQELTVFADALSAAGAGFIGWIADVINSMVAMEDMIEQIALRFGEVAGGFLISFFENMIEFAYQNQEALINLSSSLRTLFGALLDISMAVAAVLSTMSPFIEIIGFLAGLLNTDIGRAILTVIASLLIMNSTLGILMTTVAALNGVLTLLAFNSLHKTVIYILSQYVPAISTAIASTLEWVAALGALRAALLTTGVGIALVGGGLLINEAMGANASGPSTSAQSQGRGGGNTYIQVEGDVGRREAERIIDATHGTTREEMSIQEDISE